MPEHDENDSSEHASNLHNSSSEMNSSLRFLNDPRALNKRKIISTRNTDFDYSYALPFLCCAAMESVDPRRSTSMSPQTTAPNVSGVRSVSTSGAGEPTDAELVARIGEERRIQQCVTLNLRFQYYDQMMQHYDISKSMDGQSHSRTCESCHDLIRTRCEMTVAEILNKTTVLKIAKIHELNTKSPNDTLPRIFRTFSQSNTRKRCAKSNRLKAKKAVWQMGIVHESKSKFEQGKKRKPKNLWISSHEKKKEKSNNDRTDVEKGQQNSILSEIFETLFHESDGHRVLPLGRAVSNKKCKQYVKENVNVLRNRILWLQRPRVVSRKISVSTATPCLLLRACCLRGTSILADVEQLGTGNTNEQANKMSSDIYEFECLMVVHKINLIIA